MWNFFPFFFNLTSMPWFCPPAFAPVASREDRADLVSTLSAEPSPLLQGKDFTFPGCVFVGHLTIFVLGGGWGGFAWQGSWRRRRHSGQTIPPQMQKKSYHFTLKLFIQPFRSTNLPWKKLPGKDRGLKFPRLSGRIFYLTISLKSQKTKLIW